MANVRRILQFKFTLPTKDAAPITAMIQAGRPFLEVWGGKHCRLLQNVDDPTRFVHEIEYDTPEEIELNRQQIASDPRVQTYLQSWRMFMAGTIEVEVYQEAG